MEVAKIQVGGTCACAYEKKTIRAGMVGVTVSFAFDEYWVGLNKIAVYRCGGVVRDEYLEGDTGTIPAEVLTKSGFDLEIGVYGTDAEKQIAIPTCWANLGVVRPGADPSGDPAADPSLPIWAQILAKLGNLADLNTEAKENLVAAINEALTKGGGEVDPEEIGRIVDEYLEQNPPAAYTLPIATETTLGGVKAAAATEEMTQPVCITAEGKLVTVPGQNSGGNANQSTGWTAEQINLLDELFNHVHFNSAEGGTIADNLIASLRGEAVKTLVSISATYSGGEVEEGTALTALTGIVVTATYDDGSTATVYGYTLSGTIAEGENTITVSYGGKTTTFNVTGTESSGGEEEPDTTTYTVTNKLTNVTNSNAATKVEQGGSYSATLSAADGYTLDGADVAVTIGGVDFTSSVYLNGEINIATVSGDIVITATAVADITSVVVEMVENNLTREQVTIYADDGVTVDEGTYSGSIGTAVVSSMAFSADTEVRVTRKRASEGGTWITVLIGESDPSDLTKIYNAVVHDCNFVNETIERPHDYTVHAGRKLVVRYYHHLASGVLVTSSVAPDVPDVPDVPDTPVDSEVAMTYAGSNLYADAGNANAISNFTVYTDEGTTAITYPVENVDEYLNGRYISDEAFEPDTDVTITRSVATDGCWTTIVIGECDTDDESVVYNAVLSDHGFSASSTEKTYSYTVHAGRKLVMFRRNNNYNAYTLTVTK